MGRTFNHCCYLCLLVVLIGTFFASYEELSCDAFLLSQPPRTQQRITATTTTALFAKKKNKRRSGAKGFGAEPTTAEPVEKKSKPSSTNASTTTSASGPPAAVQQDQQQGGKFLQSVESGGSDAIPMEEELPPEERTKILLREKYGLKTQGEQQLEAKQLQAQQKRQEKMNKWQGQAEKKDEGGEFDPIAMLPPPVVIAIDRILKAGVAVTGTVFILAGLGITLEAWSKTTGNELPENIDQFIANTVEPNFTTGLLVLLGFSVSLGIFAGLQLGSASAVYKEDS